MPDGQTATALEVTVPVVGRVTVRADTAADVGRLEERLNAELRELHHSPFGTIDSKLDSVIQCYRSLAANAITGAESVRDDMLVFLRATVIVAETVVNEHLNHSQKNERIRGLIGVLERSIASLRDEKFTFHDSMWRRGRDLFAWNETERRLRERVQELEAQVKTAQADGAPSVDPNF